MTLALPPWELFLQNARLELYIYLLCKVVKSKLCTVLSIICLRFSSPHAEPLDLQHVLILVRPEKQMTSGKFSIPYEAFWKGSVKEKRKKKKKKKKKKITGLTSKQRLTRSLVDWKNNEKEKFKKRKRRRRKKKWGGGGSSLPKGTHCTPPPPPFWHAWVFPFLVFICFLQNSFCKIHYDICRTVHLFFFI